MSENKTPDQLFEDGLQAYKEGRLPDAFVSFYNAAQQGHAAAMYNVSISLMNGYGAVKNESGAAVWMQKCANTGYTLAYGALAEKYYFGTGVPQDLEQALYWTRKAHEADPDNQNYINNIPFLENEIAKRKAAASPISKPYVQVPYSEGKEAVQGVIDERDADAVKNIPDESARIRQLIETGLALYQNGQHEQAFQAFLEAAEKGNASAMNNVSVCYANGDGTAADPVKAFQWMKRAAESGVASSCRTLSDKYFEGYGTDQDLLQSFYWIGRAMQLDPDNAEYKSRHDYLRNQVRLEDIQKTPVILVKGSNAAAVDALIREGERLRAQKRFREALTKFVPAGKAGHYKALRYIAEMYYAGEGVPNSYNNAVAFYTAAAYRGDTVSREALAARFNTTFQTAPWKMLSYLRNDPGTADVPDQLNFRVGGQLTSEAVRMQHEHNRYPNSTNTYSLYFYKYEKATASGYPDAFAGGAYLYETNYHYVNKRLMLLKYGALLGHSYCLFELGKYYSSKDKTASKKCFEEAAKRGHRTADLQLG